MSNKLDDVKRKHIAKRNVIKTYLSVEPWRYKEKESQLDFYSLSILFIFCIILKNNSALCVMLSSLDCIYFTVFQRLKDISEL